MDATGAKTNYKLGLLKCRSEILGSSVDGTVRRFDIRMGCMYVDQLGAPVTAMALSHDGNCVLASCLDAHMRLLDKASGELLAQYSGIVLSFLDHMLTTQRSDACQDAHWRASGGVCRCEDAAHSIHCCPCPAITCLWARDALASPAPWEAACSEVHGLCRAQGGDYQSGLRPHAF